jgi:hypothetical protein
MVSRYMRSYLVRAGSPEEAVAFVQADCDLEGALVTSTGRCEPVSLTQVDWRLLPRIILASKRGVCWKSGRVFFPTTAGAAQALH